MKICIALALLLFIPDTMAATPGYKLNIQLRTGQLRFAPKMLVRAGQSSSIATKNKSGEYHLDVIAQDSAEPHFIQMKFVISKIENGTKKIIAQPEIVAQENKLAKIEIGNIENTAQTLALAVTARKVTLKK